MFIEIQAPAKIAVSLSNSGRKAAFNMVKTLKTVVFGSALFLSFCSWAIDNPDGVSKAEELDSNSVVYIEKINNATGYRSTLLAYTEYHQFLSKEIIAIYFLCFHLCHIYLVSINL